MKTAKLFSCSPYAFCIASIALMAGPAFGATVNIATEYSTPAVFHENGRLSGHATEKVYELMRRAGIDYQISVIPWKRAYNQALNRPDNCAFLTARTPEREALFKWIGPLSESDWVLYGRSGRSYDIKTLDDARHLRIGAYNGDVRADYLIARGHNVDLVQNDDSNPRKLLLDRIDLWVNSPRYVGPTLERIGAKGQIVPVLTFNHVHLYLACNPTMPPHALAKMDAAFKSMEADGTARVIEQRFEYQANPPANAPATVMPGPAGKK